MRAQQFRTRITDLFGIRHPILCGGLFLLADARYVAAVVNAGAMGFVTAMSFPDDPEDFRREIRRCRELTQGQPFGVSLAFSARSGANERLIPYVRITAEERVKFVETSGGNPQQFIRELKDAGCTVIHKVPAVRYALSAEKLGVDAITVVGGEAGGHPGVYMIGNIVQGVLAADALTLPLVLGGGMGTGRHLVTALAMGADAILLGSRMLAAKEIWAHEAYKERMIAANETENRVVMKIFRDNHRVFDNDTARAVAALEAEAVTDFEPYRPLVSGTVTREAYRSGDTSKGMLDLGPAAAFVRSVETVEAIIDGIVDEAQTALTRVCGLASRTT